MTRDRPPTMALLHKAAACLIPLLLCLHLPGIACAEALQEPPSKERVGGEVWVPLEAETRTVGRLQEAEDEAATKGASNLKGNMTREREGGNHDGEDDARTGEKPGAQEEAAQGIMESSGWFTDAINVTTRPVVTWSRRAAARRQPPVTTEKDNEEDEEDEEDDVLLTVTFMKEGHPLILDLHPTRDLLAASYTEPNGEATGENTLPGETGALPCEYQGVVRGVEQAWVALSVCGGLSGVVGVTLEGGEEVEMLVEPSPGSTSPHQPHRVFSSTLLMPSEGTCGVKDTNSKAEVGDHPGDALTHHHRMTNASASPPRRTRRWAGLGGEALWFKKKTRFVELVLVADHAFYTTHGAQTRSRCKTLVNIVNAVYRPLGVVVVLSHLEVWEDGNKIPVTGDYEENLNHFKRHRREMLEKEPHYNNDNTMLLTTVDFKGRTVGFAVVSGMCKTENSAGVVQDKQAHVGVVAYTLAHEMGHNFGMEHDGAECRCDTRACIMSGTSGGAFQPHVSWSSCSQRIIEKNVDSESYQCLTNVPTRMYPRSSCGDGVVDYGEQCDCGPAEFCDNPCCVAATCSFAVNASCASGPCCDTKKCQFKPVGVGCREAFTECDLPEFCSGSSESCPEDFTKIDGTPCNRGQGYCYEGRCGSHEAMCSFVWGKNAMKAEDACYSNLNTRAETNGNCGFKGHTKTELLPCQGGDTLCGTLQCLKGANNEPILKMPANYGTYSSRYQCSYIVASPRLPEKYWLVPDGAMCGQGKMCLKKKCVNISEPSGDCRGGCSGHGVCNSLNHCHCDPGYAPPDCSGKGEGGSIDSCRIGRGRYIDPLWETLFVLSLLALGAATLLCCLWSHVRRWWEARGRASTQPCCARCLDACCCPLMSLITDRLCNKKRNENVTKEAKHAWEQDKMICQVDLDLKDKASHSHSWGVANEKLVTDVVTMKPNFSPDFSRKIQLSSRHCVPHTKVPQTDDRPAYTQSVSVDSGCVSDVKETVVEEPYDSRVSMKSLASLFKMFRTRQDKEGSPPRAYERQRSVPLRRLVVDPLAGSRRSRHGTPSPDNARLEWGRSVSQDEQSASTGRPGGAPPPPPPATEKPYTSKNKSPHGCKSARQEGISPPPPPLRPAPTPASTPPPAPSWQPRKPMMPPGKKETSITIKTQSKTEITTKISATQQDKAPQTSPPRRPLLPPDREPEPARPAKLPKAPGAYSKPRAAGNAPPPRTTGGRVKDLAKKLEKQ